MHALVIFHNSMPVFQIEVLKSDLKEISDEYVISRYGQHDIICLSSEKIFAYGMGINNLDVIY